jgi:hypothetical protein
MVIGSHGLGITVGMRPSGWSIMRFFGISPTGILSVIVHSYLSFHLPQHGHCHCCQVDFSKSTVAQVSPQLGHFTIAILVMRQTIRPPCHGQLSFVASNCS